MEHIQQRLTTWFWEGSDRAASILCPGWRWMFIVAGSALLWASVIISSPGSGSVPAFSALLGTIIGAIALITLWLALQPHLPPRLITIWDRLPAIFHWRLWFGLLTLFLVVSSWHAFTDNWQAARVGVYHNDAIAYVHEDADLLARGQNPYTSDEAFWEAAARWPLSLATPLLNSKSFTDNPKEYPTARHIATVLQYERLNPDDRNGSFDPATVHNYPAGIIWLALPLVLAGATSVIWLNIIALIFLMGLLLKRVSWQWRLPLLLTLLANPVLPTFSLTMNFDVVCFAFVIAAWNWMKMEKTSALLMGAACAVKQLAWFIAPFYLIEVARREGPQAAIRRGAWMSLSFLIPNLPFILSSPGAWLHSMFIPMSSPMFPLGFGPVVLMLGGVVPNLPPHFWSILELSTWVGLMVYAYRRRSIISDGMILGLIPIWLSWRSPMNYFAFIPYCALWAATQPQLMATMVYWRGHLAERFSSSDRIPVLGDPDDSHAPELAGIR